MQVGLDELVVDLSLGLIGGEYVDPVGAFGSLIGRHYHHAIGARFLSAGPLGLEAADHCVSTVAKILRLCVPLAAIAEDGDRLALQRLRIGITFIKNFDHSRAPLIAQGEEAPAILGWTPNCALIQGKMGAKSEPTGRSVIRRCYRA